MYMKHQGI